jgi:hypothetical protein
MRYKGGMTLREAKAAVHERLKHDSRLLGIGIGRDGIVVNWSEDADAMMETLYTEWSGWPVIFTKTGPSTAF